MAGELVCFPGCTLIDISMKPGFSKGGFIRCLEQKINSNVNTQH